MSPLKKVWTCPDCRRPFRVPRSAAPSRCPACEQAAASGPAEPTRPAAPPARPAGSDMAPWPLAVVAMVVLFCGGGGLTFLACLGIASGPAPGPPPGQVAAWPDDRGTPDRAREWQADEIYDRVKPAVVFIVAFDARKEPLGMGSGFFVDRDGTVVTNHHVVSSPGTTYVALKRDDEEIAVVTELVAVDKAYDLAVLDSGLRNTSYIPLAPATSRIGAKVYAVGNPQGLTWSLSDGLISSVRPWKGTAHPWIQTTTPISSGSSGGPLVDASARLVGVTTSGLASGENDLAQNLNFASPVAALREVLQRPRGFISIRDLSL